MLAQQGDKMKWTNFTMHGKGQIASSDGSVEYKIKPLINRNRNRNVYEI